MSKLHTIGNVLTAFLITILVVLTLALASHIDEGGLSFDGKTLSFTAFGNTYTLDEHVPQTLEKLCDFNAVFVGKEANNVIKSALAYPVKLVMDTFNVVYTAADNFVTSCT